MPRILQRAGRQVGAIILSLLLSACSYTAQTTRLEQAPPPDLPVTWELKETPFFAQQRYQCGPAALATILVDRGIDVHPDALVNKVYLPERRGSVTVEMEAAARRYGLLVYPLVGDLEGLLQEVAAGNPVLVLQNLGFDWWPRWHYAVAIGYDLNEETITLRSGVTRRYVVSLGVFETTWRRAEYWARVVLPAGVIPVSAEAFRYLKAASDLEQSGMKEAALSGYRAATRHWSESALAWLARGNLAYQLGGIDEAEASFRSGLKGAPDNAVLWNNLAYALVRQQCAPQALTAVRCAVALEPENREFRDTLQELSVIGGAAGVCRPVSCPVPEEKVSAQ